MKKELKKLLENAGITTESYHPRDLAEEDYGMDEEAIEELEQDIASAIQVMEISIAQIKQNTLSKDRLSEEEIDDIIFNVIDSQINDY